jgi:hypothetical protein
LSFRETVFRVDEFPIASCRKTSHLLIALRGQILRHPSGAQEIDPRPICLILLRLVEPGAARKRLLEGIRPTAETFGSNSRIRAVIVRANNYVVQ